jgi:malonate transporter and related proteins
MPLRLYISHASEDQARVNQLRDELKAKQFQVFPCEDLPAVKLVIMPLIVYGLSVSLGLDPLYTIAAVICAAVPTAKTAYILAGEYRCEEMMVASTVSMTTLASIISLVVWLYGLSGLATRIAAG